MKFLTCITLIIAIAALIVNIFSTVDNWCDRVAKKENLYYAVCKELEQNNQVIDALLKHEQGLKEGKKIFLKDFQFSSYNALRGNMSIRGELAERVMDCYQNLEYVQNTIEVGRALSPERKEFVKGAHELTFNTMEHENLKSNLEYSINGFKNLYKH